MQVGVLEDVLELIPRKDIPERIDFGGTQSDLVKHRKFQYTLKRDTYKRVMIYLADK